VAWEADVLHLSARHLLIWSIVLTLPLGVVLGLLTRTWWLGVILAVAGFYLLPNLRVRLSYKSYQTAMRIAFETQVLLLRIYFDLGMPVVTAFRAMRVAVSGVAQQEIDRVLSDLSAGQRDAAFEDWAQRTQLLEYRLLANTIVQQRGRALEGETMKPLEILLSANRQQTMKILTDKLMTSAAAVPILSTLAVLILYIYALMVNIRGMQALHFHL
jgi:Flp pilus assembly protein TadB